LGPTGPSFDVLHLLAGPLDPGLELHDGVGRLGVERLRADRVGLAGQLLAQEVERPAGRLRVEQAVELGHVALQTGELLGHVGAIGDQGHFAGDVGGRDGDALGGEQLRHPFGQAAAVLVEHRRHAGGDARRDSPHFAEHAAELAGQGLGLGPSHGVEAVERGGERAGDEGPGLVGSAGCRHGVEHQPRQAEQAVDGARGGQVVAGAEPLEVVEVGLELGRVEPSPRRGDGPGELELHLHCAAANPLPHGRLGAALEARAARLGVKRELEEPVVDDPQLDAAAARPVGRRAHAAAGHAAEGRRAGRRLLHVTRRRVRAEALRRPEGRRRRPVAGLPGSSPAARRAGSARRQAAWRRPAGPARRQAAPAGPRPAVRRRRVRG
jgi:hypothetical protein